MATNPPRKEDPIHALLLQFSITLHHYTYEARYFVVVLGVYFLIAGVYGIPWPLVVVLRLMGKSRKAVIIGMLSLYFRGRGNGEMGVGYGANNWCRN